MEKLFLKKDNDSKEFFILLSLLKNEDIQFNNEIDFHKLINLSVEHRVFFILYDEFEKLAKNDFEKLNYLQRIKKRLQFNSFKNLSVLIDIIKIFNDNNIEFLPFKGIILSKILYGDFYNRGSIDIDLLILNEKDKNRIFDVLIDHGYTLADKKFLDNKFFQFLYFKAKNSVQFINRQNNVKIDLHYRLFGNRIFTAKVFNLFVKNTSSFNLYGNKINILSLEYYFLFICVHSSIHCFKRLLWINDVYMFLKNYDIDLLKVYQIARNYQLEKHFMNAIFMCNKLFYVNKYICEKKMFNITKITFCKLPEFLKNEDSFSNRIFKFFYKIRLSASIIEFVDIILSHILRLILKVFSVL